MGARVIGTHHALPILLPAQPLAAEPYDPVHVSNGQVLTSGFLWTVRVTVSRPALISRLWAMVYTAGNTLTSGQNFMALFTSDGTRVGVTASLHTLWQSAGVANAALTTPYAAVAGDYYIGALANGTTGPNVLGASLLAVGGGSVGNVGNRARRFGLAATGLTAMPASIDPALIDGSISVSLWLGAD